MAQYAAYRRVPVQQQLAQNLQVRTFPAPTRGIIQHENDAFMNPGGALISDNWLPTMKGVKLRGGIIRWCDLHALDAPAWVNATAYTVGNQRSDAVDGTVWQCAVAHTSAATPTTFAQDRLANSTFWTAVTTFTRKPVISAFEYTTGVTQKMFAGQDTRLVDVTTNTPVLVKSGQTSGNYAAAQLATASALQWLIAVNESGDPPLRFNGTSWVTLDPSAITAWANSTAYAIGALAKDTVDNTYWKALIAHTSAGSGTFAADRTATPGRWTSAAASDNASYITGPIGTPVVDGKGLSHVAKYRNRLFFCGTKSMSLWYLPINAVGGQLVEIPLSGSATKGGFLMFAASWSIDAGDGIDDKLAVVTSEGEVLIFTGNNPADVNNWVQQGRYAISPPLGINAYANVGGDLLLLTVDGIVPISQAITKSAGELELALITRPIKRMWREEVAAKRVNPWTLKKWDEFGGNFVTFPGGSPGNRYALAFNNATGAFARCFGWDAMCFIRMRADMFFGTQDGIIMQCERTGYEDGKPYVCRLVMGWEMFGSPANTFVWHQARAVFASAAGEPFQPTLAATVDYQINVPPPPPVGPDPGVADIWDQGLWDQAKWDAPYTSLQPVRNTMWQSIGMTGFAHAPIVQVSIGQQALPVVELIALSAIYEPAGVNVD